MEASVYGDVPWSIELLVNDRRKVSECMGMKVASRWAPAYEEHQD